MHRGRPAWQDLGEHRLGHGSQHVREAGEAEYHAATKAGRAARVGQQRAAGGELGHAPSLGGIALAIVGRQDGVAFWMQLQPETQPGGNRLPCAVVVGAADAAGNEDWRAAALDQGRDPVGDGAEIVGQAERQLGGLPEFLQAGQEPALVAVLPLSVEQFITHGDHGGTDWRRLMRGW